MFLHFPQALIQSLMKSASNLCPSLVQKVNMQEQFISKVADKIVNPKNFARSMIIDQTGLGIVNKLRSGYSPVQESGI